VKLVLQIALGVLLGTLASQLSIDAWRDHQDSLAKQAADTLRAEQEKVRLAQGERIRALLMQGRQDNTRATKPPVGFVPDDAQTETFKAE